MTQPLDKSLYSTVAYRTAFDFDRRPTMMKFEASMTLLQMTESFSALPPDFWVYGDITIGGHMVPREIWHRVRLKPGVDAVFYYPPRGGGSSQGGKRSKGILALVIGIATVLTAGAALAGSFAAGGFFLSGSTSAQLLAGAITVAGQLLQKALSPPPAAPDSSKNDQAKGAASASGNLLEAGAPIPAVLGTMKVYPSLLTQPYTYRVNGDEIVEAIFGLAGPHDLASPKIGNTDLATATDTTIEIREGWDDDIPLETITRYATTAQPGIELSSFDTDPDDDDQQQLRNQTVFTPSLPIFHPVAAANNPDWINIDFSFLEGLYYTTDPDLFARIALRIRMRNLDTLAVYNLPEVHYSSKTARELRPTIVLKWMAPLAVQPLVPARGFDSFFYSVPTQDVAPVGLGGWTADASFYSGSGDTYIEKSNMGSSGVIRSYNTSVDEVTFALDETAIPRGRYQIEVMRGTSFKVDDFSKSSYQLSGNVLDLFGYRISSGVAKSPTKRSNIADRVGLVRVSSVFNRHPINGGMIGSGLALIAVKATNRSVENLSVLASKYVRAWDGTGWNNWTLSSNPADQYYEILRGTLTPDPLALVVIDNAGLVEWRQACIALGYTCNMICEGDSITDILGVVASCGYAQPRMSDRWGVIRDYDRSAEEPSQVFTAANSFGMTMENEFIRLPDAFRVIWVDAAADYASGEEIVFRPGVPETAQPRLEEITYKGLTTRAAAIQRAIFDLTQVQARAASFSFGAAAEAIRSTRGDLIAVNHDFIDKFHDSGRLVDVEVSDGMIVSVTMDRDVRVYNELDMLGITDMLAVPDMFLIGATSSVCFRQSTGFLSTHAVSGTGTRSRLQLASPVPLDIDDDDYPTIRPGNLAWVGTSGNEYMRLVITGMTYDKNMTAQIKAVAEAPELFA